MILELCKTKSNKLWYKKVITLANKNIWETDNCFVISNVFKITTKSFYMYVYSGTGMYAVRRSTFKGITK